MMLQQFSLKSMSAILRHGLHYQLGKGAVRPISNSHVTNPASGFDWLFECAPSFYIDENNVQVLEEPSEFYNTLKILIFVKRRKGSLLHLCIWVQDHWNVQDLIYIDWS